MHHRALGASAAAWLLITAAALAHGREPPGPEALRAALQSGGSAGLGFAHAALLAPGDALFRVAIDELARDTRDEARTILRDAASRIDPMDPRCSVIQRAWASSYVLAGRAHAADAAALGLADATADPLDRALHLLAHHEASPGDRDVYWRYLRDDEAWLRRAALQVNGDLWDFGALSLLLDLEDDTDPVVRRDGRHLARRYLIWGPLRPTPLERKMANTAFEPHDRDALRAWRTRASTWDERQAELMQAQHSGAGE